MYVGGDALKDKTPFEQKLQQRMPPAPMQQALFGDVVFATEISLKLTNFLRTNAAINRAPVADTTEGKDVEGIDDAAEPCDEESSSSSNSNVSLNDNVGATNQTSLQADALSLNLKNVSISSSTARPATKKKSGKVTGKKHSRKGRRSRTALACAGLVINIINN